MDHPSTAELDRLSRGRLPAPQTRAIPLHLIRGWQRCAETFCAYLWPSTGTSAPKPRESSGLALGRELARTSSRLCSRSRCAVGIEASPSLDSLSQRHCPSSAAPDAKTGRPFLQYKTLLP